MKKTIAGFAALGIAATAATLAFSSLASAALDNSDMTPANSNVLPAAVRIIPTPGTSLAANQQISVAVAGKTFGDVTVPANATGVVLSVSANSPTANGAVRVWTDGAGEPSTGAVEFNAGQSRTNLAFIALADSGKVNFKVVGAKVNLVVGLMSFDTPVQKDPLPVKINPTEKALTHIGPSVRTDNATPGSGVTDMGSVTLAAGTYDTRVIGGFSGLKSSAANGDSTLYGGLFITKGAGIPAGFGNVLAQTQGVTIPKTNSGSGSYTIDPTIQTDTFITLTESTDVHVQMYAYSSNGAALGSGDANDLGVKANLASAYFKKIS